MFDLNKFEQATITQRTRELDVPLLQDFYEKKQKPIWVIHALTSEDVAMVNDAEERNAAVGTLVTAMLGNNKNSKADAIKSAMGIGEESPADIVRRIEIILRGSTNLNVEEHRDIVIKIAMYYPTVFMTISNEILSLSGEGGLVEGKP
jgi:hypothetical protein